VRRANGERFDVAKTIRLMINKLINIMRRRCTAVMDKTGYRTRY